MDEQLFPQGTAQQHPQMTGQGQGFGQGNLGPALGGAAPGVIPVSASAQLSNVATRVKLAEERYANLAKRNQLTEESLLAFEKEIKAELRALTQQTVELRKRVSEINTKVDAMTGELGSVVRKHELAALDHYLDLWQPMQFITMDQARRIIDDARRDAAERDAPSAPSQGKRQ